MTEKIKKIFISLSIFLLFSLFSPLHFSLAAPMPSCSISFTPNVIKQGEISIESWQTMGPLDGMSFKCTGILSYMGGYTMDFTDPEFLKNINAQELINGTSNSGQIKPSKIGEGSCTITVWGPGGNNSCSASIKVVAVDINNEKEQEFIGVLVIPGTLRDCPSKDCDVKRYYAETARIRIVGIDDSSEWYEVIAKDDYGNDLSGWMHYSLFTQDFRSYFSNNQQQDQGTSTQESTTTITQEEKSPNKLNISLTFIKNKAFQLGSAIILVFVLLLLTTFLTRKRIKIVSKPELRQIALEKEKIISNWNGIIMALLISIVIIGTALGAIAYQRTSDSFRIARELAEEEKYDEAITQLETIQNNWLTKIGFKKQEISDEINKNKELLEDKSEYTQGIEEFNQGKWERAKELFLKVSEMSSYYQDAKNKIEIVQDNIVQAQISKAIAEAVKESKKIIEETQRDTTELERKITELQQKQQTSVVSEISTSLTSNDINRIIKGVLLVLCSANRSITSFNIGSGFTWNFSDIPGNHVFTNAHVILTDDGSPTFCLVFFPQLPSGTPYYAYWTEVTRIGYTGNQDWAILKITNPTKPQYTLSQVPLLSEYPMCNFSDVNIGDKVTIFGYPAVGGESITVTEGNISGFDGNNYKVSSGIIDKGNSGGAAILNKNKCSLGIPTWFVSGKASSVGIIQSWRTVYNDLLM